MQWSKRFTAHGRGFRDLRLLASASFVDMRESVEPRLQFGDTRQIVIYNFARGNCASPDFFREFDERPIVEGSHLFLSRLRVESVSVKFCRALAAKAVDDHDEGRENWLGLRRSKPPLCMP